MRLSTTIINIPVAIIYGLLALGSLQFAFQSSNASPIWPAAGFALAVVLLRGPQMAPGIFIGAFTANVIGFLASGSLGPVDAVLTSLLMGAGNMLEALAGYYLLKRFYPGITDASFFNRVQPVLHFFLAAALICLVAAFTGSTATWLAGVTTGDNFLSVLFTWWVGDFTGILLITPLILTWLSGRFDLKEITGNNILATFVLVTAIAITSGTVFFNWFDLHFLFSRAFIITPFIIWAAVRLPLKLITLLLLFSAVIVNMGTMDGIGPFIGPTVNDSLLTTEVFIAVNCIMALIIKSAIHQQEQTETSLREARDQLEETVRQRTLELELKNKELEVRNNDLASFNYAASHDLQEPLRKIQTFADRIEQQEGDNLSEKGKDMFRRMQEASARMKNLIENLLAYLHVDNKEELFEKVDLDEILDRVQSDLSTLIQQENAVIRHNKLPVVRVIPFQFEQLFHNLITNAIKFHKPGEQPVINIHASLTHAANLPEHNGNGQIAYHHITVSDNGIGLEQAYCEKIFGIFQRLHGHSEYKGTGIGLAICKKIIENHHGHIFAESSPGKGLTIHIYLQADENGHHPILFPMHENQLVREE